MQLLESFAPYWPVIAASALFFVFGLWWRLAAARAMELTPKPIGWVKRYRAGGFPFRRELLGSPKLHWPALLLVLLFAAAVSAGRYANDALIYLGRAELFFNSRYGILQLGLYAVGAGAVFCLLNVLFDSRWVALPGAALFAASAVRGHGETCILAVSLLLLFLYLRAEKPAFPAELLYLAAIMTFAPMFALRFALIWLAPCFVAVHWYKLISQRRAQQLSGWQLFFSLLAALAVWVLTLVLTANLNRYLMSGFRTRELLTLLKPEQVLGVFRELAGSGCSGIFAAPMPGMTVDLMLDAPLFGFGFWGCWSAWTLAKKRRDSRGVFVLAVLAVLLVIWLITGRYALTLGLVLTAACILRDADIAKKRVPVILLTLAGICWYIVIQVAAWYVPLTTGLVERLLY